LAESTLLADWLSLSLVEKKKAGTVLVCNEQNACVGLGRLAHGFCSEHRSEKFSQEILHIIFVFWFSVAVRFSPAITFPAKIKKSSVSRCVLNIIQQEHSPVGTWNRTDLPMRTTESDSGIISV
jgi:hypothetical protein